MSTQTAKFILKRHGLACFSLRELRGLLSDRYQPLPGQVKSAIQTLLTPERTTHYAQPY